MCSVFYSHSNLVIALKSKIIFVNPNDLQIFKEVRVPEDLKCKLDPPTADGTDSNDEMKHNGRNLNKSSQIDLPIIKHVAVSPDNSLLAVTTSGQKAILFYECRMENAKLIHAQSLTRASSAIVFSPDSKSLLITDKTGDCYMHNCSDFEIPPRLLFGHLSIIFDIIWSPSTEYIITCDRDDKIRITNYPNTHDIHGYCLGHTEFVAGLSLLMENIIISISGDKSMRLWNYVLCEELCSIEMRGPGLKMVSQQVNESKFKIAALMHQLSETVAIYEVSKTSNQWNFKENEILNYLNMEVHNICFADNRLYVMGLENKRLRIKVSDVSNGGLTAPLNWLEMVEKEFENIELELDDVSIWFKKRYDNVSEYLSRKKRRIENTNNNKHTF